VSFISSSDLALDFCCKIADGGGSPIGIFRDLDCETLSVEEDFEPPVIEASQVIGLTDELSVDVEILGWVFSPLSTGFASEEDSNFSSSRLRKTGNVGIKGFVKLGSGESKPAGGGGGGGG